MNEPWTRAAAGLDTVFLGAALPRLHGELTPLRVHCAPPSGPLGPLRSACDRARRALGQPPPAWAMPTAGPRQRLLDAGPGAALDAVVDALNALAVASSRRRVLVLEDVDAADGDTLAGLERIVRRPGWLKMPLLLAARGAPGPALAPLLAAVAEVAGPEAIVLADDATADAPALPALPRPPVALVLRAAALVGEAFTVELVADVLGKSPAKILRRLQEAADAGWPLADDGAGHLRLAAPAVQALRAGLLPSLAREWHLRLAELRTPEAEPRAPAPAPDVPEVEPQGPENTEDSPASPPPPTTAEDPSAAHLLAAGETEAAVDRLLAAAREAAELGAPQHALALVERGLQALDALPRTDTGRLRRAGFLIALARARQVGGDRADLTLGAAREAADAAAALVREDDPLPLQADLAAVRAGILYDIGTAEALEDALATLTACSKRLDAGGAPIEAARLFNDQAAIWIRLGDPVRAHGLLEASRRVFAARAGEDRVALWEQAETDLLIARLPLHVHARPGREGDAVSMGLEHARAAEAAWAKLGHPRLRARARETIGRLELQAGQVDAAIATLEGAARVQQQLGDALGLAATVEALARALSARGQHDTALELVAESLALNVEKGAIRGAAYVRRALEGVVQGMDAASRQRLAGRISRLSGILAEQEARLKGWDGGS
ncbi:MAG: tetratricopeptide repeat protein [Myxococcales bacterium]|nr:tetratricopeptide repeat protein [Myxococcales bacterium]